MFFWDDFIDWMNVNVVNGLKENNTIVIIAVSMTSMVILICLSFLICSFYKCYKCFRSTS